MNAARGPTANAVGYFLAPLRGCRGPRILRLTKEPARMRGTHFRLWALAEEYL